MALEAFRIDRHVFVVAQRDQYFRALAADGSAEDAVAAVLEEIVGSLDFETTAEVAASAVPLTGPALRATLYPSR